MSNTLSCADFIVEQIRVLRSKQPNIKGGKAGVRLHRLWTVASKYFKEEEFRAALNTLLSKRIIIGVWSVTHQEAGSISSPYRVEFLNEVSKDIPLTARSWTRVIDGTIHEKPFVGIWKMERTVVEWVRFYIITDGLPKTIREIHDRSASVRK